MSSVDANVETARRYLEALTRRAEAAEIAEFFAPDVVQEEFPNRLVPQGARRDLPALMEGRERGMRVMSAESYEVRNVVSSGDSVALEVLWTGTLAVPVGSLPAGGAMRAHFGVLLDFRDGRIVASATTTASSHSRRSSPRLREVRHRHRCREIHGRVEVRPGRHLLIPMGRSFGLPSPALARLRRGRPSG